MKDPETTLRGLFDAALAAVRPVHCLPRFLPEQAAGRTVVIGAGKAAAAMALVVEQHYAGLAEGLVVVPDGHGLATQRIEVASAGHPVPDARSVSASRRVRQLVASLAEEDRVVCLLSGGGSALLCLPPESVSLAEKQALTTALLNSGARIAEINCVRKHLSRVKGGRLAAACFPAPCLTLAISDVPGDDLSLVASGPTMGDATTREDARAVLEKYGLTGSASVISWLNDARSESPKPGSQHLARSEIVCVAKAADALTAAASAAEKMGIDAVMLGDDLEGEARNLASRHARLVRTMIAGEQRPVRPRVLLSGGEATVRVTGRGRGGRNGEYALALACSLSGQPGVYALACDTDGKDGVGDNAGALLSPETLHLAEGRGIDARRCLDENDALGFFTALEALVVTGPTLTNVNDFRAILLLPEAWGSRRAPHL